MARTIGTIGTEIEVDNEKEVTATTVETIAGTIGVQAMTEAITGMIDAQVKIETTIETPDNPVTTETDLTAGMIDALVMIGTDHQTMIVTEVTVETDILPALEDHIVVTGQVVKTDLTHQIDTDLPHTTEIATMARTGRHHDQDKTMMTQVTMSKS